MEAPNSPGEDPRKQLGQFLRARREQLRPEDLGFPSGGRRRTPGLRREEVAVAAGLSATWYTYLEQGRGNEVSPGVLDSIARALQLTDGERRYMYLLMYGHTPPAEAAPLVKPPPTNIAIVDVIKNIIAATNTYPYPIYSADHACNLISWNDATKDWYDDFGKMPPKDRNFIRWMFGSQRAREVLADWEIVARDLVARWRIDFAPEPTHADARSLADQFSDEFPEFREWWNDRHVVTTHDIGTRTFRRPNSADCELMIVPLLTTYDSMPGILVHYPVNQT